MTVSEAQKKASVNYKKAKIKRVPLDLQKSQYEEIKAAATAAGESVNGFIKIAIEKRMESEALPPAAVPDPEESQE